MNGGGSLSDFLSQLELGGQCWCYVDVRGGNGLSLPSCDAVFVYAVLQSDVRVSCAVGGTVPLGKGDVAVVLSGEAHAVRDGEGSLVRPHAFLREATAVDMPPTSMIGDTGGVSARVLAARLAADWPRQIRRKSLPACLHMHGGGYVFGCAEMCRAATAVIAAEAQCLVVSVDYRLAPETRAPGPLKDCYAALGWLHADADGLGDEDPVSKICASSSATCARRWKRPVLSEASSPMDRASAIACVARAEPPTG